MAEKRIAGAAQITVVQPVCCKGAANNRNANSGADVGGKLHGTTNGQHTCPNSGAVTRRTADAEAGVHGTHGKTSYG